MCAPLPRRLKISCQATQKALGCLFYVLPVITERLMVGKGFTYR